jgi:PAS domain S-box-containing protein
MRIENIFLRNGNPSFQQQLIFLFVSGIFCLALLSSLAISTLSFQIVRDRWVTQGSRATEIFAEQMTLALLYLSEENAEAPVRSILAFPDVRGVAIYDAQRTLLLERGEKMPPQEGWPQKLQIERETELAWYFAAPVFAYRSSGEVGSPFVVTPQQREHIGVVRLILSKEPLNAIERRIFQINFAVSGGFGLLLLLLLLLLTRRLSTPLNLLAQIMVRASTGEKGVRAEIRGPRDIVEMEIAFNNMMDVLEGREKQLEAARDSALETVRVNALLSFSLNNVHEFAMLMDESGRFLYVNDESCRSLGYNTEELLSMAFMEICTDWTDERWNLHWQEVRNKGSIIFETRCRQKDGSFLSVEVSANYFEYGNNTYNLALARDVTERKRAENEILRLNAELEQRVSERTAELSAKNQDLERMNKLFVGRELRMVELKEQIKVLETDQTQ